MILDWRIMATAFGMVFLAELGDKTQLAAMLLSAESGNIWSVFLGASGALVLSTLLAVTLGAALTRLVPDHYIRMAAGTIFVVLGALILLDR